MTEYVVKFTRLARNQLRNETVRSRNLYGRDHQEQFLQRIVHRLSLVGERPHIHQVKAELGQDVRLFQELGLKIACSVDDEVHRIIVLVVAGRSQEMQRAVEQAVAAWDREQLEPPEDEPN